MIVKKKKKDQKDLEEKYMKKLNGYLSDLVVFYNKLHDLHWNVKGKMFVQVHMYTESRYEDMASKFDEVAEMIVMNGQAPITSMKEHVENASIQELNKGRYRDDEVLQILIDDMSLLRKEAYKLREEYEDEFAIVNMLEAHIESYNKELWFLNSMMA